MGLLEASWELLLLHQGLPQGLRIITLGAVREMIVEAVRFIARPAVIATAPKPALIDIAPAAVEIATAPAAVVIEMAPVPTVTE